MKKYRLLALFLVLVFTLGVTIGCNTKKVEETVEKVEEKATEVADKVGEKAGEAADKVEEKAGEVAGKVEDKVEEIKGDLSSKKEVNFAVMTGPTGAGSVNLIDNSKNDKSNFTIKESIVGTPDEIVTGLVNGSIDMAVIPANLASVLYNRTEGNIVALATNNLGVVYVVEKGNSIQSFENLVGKTIVAAGKGATPEVVFRNIAVAKGLNPDEDLTLDFKTEATEAAQALISGQSDIGLIPEPMVTNVLMKNPDFRIALDLNKEWKDVNNSYQITSVLVSRRDFLEKIDVKEFLKEFSNSIETAKNEVDNTAKLLGEYKIIPEEVAKKANFNLYYMDGEELKTNLMDYLNILFKDNPKSVGGKVPGEDFFLQGE